MTDNTEVNMTSVVNGCSKFIFSALACVAFQYAELIRYETKLVTTIITRIAKIHTSSCTWFAALPAAANKMNVMSATPVTP